MSLLNEIQRILRNPTQVKRSANPNIVLVLVGNKADIASQRTVSEEEAQALARKHGLIYVEASAKTGHNVDKAFERVAEGIIDKIARCVRLSK